MTEENKSVVDKVNKTFDDNDTEAFLSYCAEDIVWVMPGNKTYKGKESIREMMKDHLNQPPMFTIKNVIAENDLVMCNGDMKMKDKKGNLSDYAFCDVYLFKEQKIAELTSYIIRQKN